MGNGKSSGAERSSSTPNLGASQGNIVSAVSTPNLVSAVGEGTTLNRPSTGGMMSSSHRPYTIVGNIKVTVIKGCFYHEKADVIVNSCSSDLNLAKGKGTKALLEAAGQSVQDELNREDGITSDDIAVTCSGKLKCNKIYHVTLPKYQAGGNALTVLKNVIISCLQMAHDNHSTSIVFPTMGTVFLDYDVTQSAQTAFQAITEFSRTHKNSSVKRVTWAIFDQGAYKEYVKEAIKISGTEEEGKKEKMRKEEKRSVLQRSNKDHLMVGAKIPLGSLVIIVVITGTVSRRISCSVMFGNTNVLLVTGSLADEKADVLVNSAPQDLQLNNGGLSKSLLQRAGPKLQEECDNEFGNGLDSGKVAVTNGYKLRCKKVYHGFLPEWDTASESLDPQEELRILMEKCLELANEYHTTSITFPTLGTGSLKYPANITAETMIDCVESFVTDNPNTSLKTVTIVIYNQRSGWQAVEKAFQVECNKWNPNPQPSTSPRSPFQGSSESCCSITFGQISVDIKVGQLIDEQATVIVNSAPQDMKLSNGGLSEFLLKSAGQELQDSCDRNYGNGIDYGSVAVTGGYNLPCQYVYHTCLPAWTITSPDPSETLEDVVLTCLMEADRHDTPTIAFPTLGTGSLKYPADVTATTMLQAIEDFSDSYPNSLLTNITIVIYHRGKECSAVTKAFQRICKDKFSSPAPTQVASPTKTEAKAPPARGTAAFLMHKYKEVHRPPTTWTHFKAKKMLQDWNMNLQKGQEVKLIPVDKSTRCAMEQIVEKTWMSQFVGAGNDARGLDQLNYTQIKVTNVERIENPMLFEKYAQNRAQLFYNAGKNGTFSQLENVANSSGPLLTTKVANRELKEDIYPEINEHYCFHGTYADRINVICTQGLDMRLTVNNALGNGIYLAESATKSDQYADPRDKRDKKEKKMLLVRTCLGEQHVIKQPKAFRRPPCKQCKNDLCVDTNHGGSFDSVVIDGHWNFREFVVYDSARVYPEFVISYQRC